MVATEQSATGPAAPTSGSGGRSGDRAPVPIPNAIAIFQLRAIEEIPAEGEVTAIDYAAFYIPGGQSAGALQQAALLDARVDTCDDLYGVASGLPEGRLQRDSLPPGEIPGDVALGTGQTGRE